MHQLGFDPHQAVARPLDFDARAYPRTRSYEGAEAFVEMAASRPPGPGSRFAGRLAAIYGADRQLLGNSPSDENVTALVHKALILLCAEDRCDAEVVFVVDSGAKAASVSRYVATLPRTIEFALRSYRRPHERRLHVRLRAEIIDAAESAVAALPAELDLGRRRQVLLVDIGHLRTKLAVVSDSGCELQEQLPIGMADCVRRVMRDGQELGLVEDEFAVVRALESAPEHVISIGERRFDIRVPLGNARRAIEEELSLGIRRIVLAQFGRRGESCQAVAILGGGAAAIGRGLAARLEASNIGLRTVWVAPDPSFLLLEGARKRRPGRAPSILGESGTQ